METFNEAVEDAIISACNKHQEDNWKKEGYRACISTDAYFVKFGDYKALWPEIQTQIYVATFAESLVDAPKPRIPKVLHHFEREKKRAYLVMEKIKLIHYPSDLPERRLEAITWLATVPAPKGHVLGPLGGGRIRHSFFKNNIAPFDFRSVQELESYVKEGCKKLHRKDPFSITNERLVFTQSDMHDSNFGVDEQGKTVLLDFGEIALLPESFARFTLSSKKFAPIIDSVGLLGESNMGVMRKIAVYLGMAANPKFSASAYAWHGTTT